jgi:hypothetical protein
MVSIPVRAHPAFLVILPLIFFAIPDAAAQDRSLRLEGSAVIDDTQGPEGPSADCHEGWAACGVWHHDQRAEGKYRLAAMDCYPSLGRALDLEDEAFEINQQLPGTTGDEQSEVVDRFNEKIKERGTALRDHRDCIVEWYRAHRPPPQPERKATDDNAANPERPGNAGAGNRGWARKLDDALGKIPYLHELDRFLAEISDYDMTKPHTGAKVVAESVASLLGEAGFNYMVKSVPKALAAMGARATGGRSTAAGADAALEGSTSALGGSARAAGDAAGGAAPLKSVRAGAAETSEIGPPPGQNKTGGADMSDVGPPPSAGDTSVPPGQGTSGGVDMSDVGPPPSAAADKPLPPGILRTGEHIDTVAVWETQLPAGAQLSRVVKQTPREVALQQETHSCAIACTQMVTQTHLGLSWSEEAFRQMSSQLSPRGYQAVKGTWMDQIPEALSHVGIQNSGLVGASVDDLARATELGHPAVVAIGEEGAHNVVVDQVVDSSVGRFVIYRDPVNFSLLSSQTQSYFIDSGFKNAVVATEAEFTTDFLQGVGRNGQMQGLAVFTRPDWVPHPDSLVKWWE